MKLMFIAVALICFTALACKKSEPDPPTLLGSWVEKSIRLDTLDFFYTDLFGPAMQWRSANYTDSVLNPNFPVNHSGLYSCLHLGDSVRLRNIASSSGISFTYHLSFLAGGNTFSIGKFYSRRPLAAIIEFERVR
ncbi:MAG: hypothetical protein V4722_22540 [Bacteroidota bacterium]